LHPCPAHFLDCVSLSALCFQDLFARPLRYLGFGSKPVNTVRRSDSLRQALEAFRLGQHRALAVVDDSQGGRLVGNFSASDVKLLFPAEAGSKGTGTSTTAGATAQTMRAPSLDLSLGEFLDQYSSSSLKVGLQFVFIFHCFPLDSKCMMTIFWAA
jgi:hypothetical protein